MNDSETSPATPDPAAIFAIALSLWKALHPTDDSAAPSAASSTADGRMRQVMAVATTFETWACRHVDFAQLDDIWPYLLEDCFGPAFPEIFGWGALDGFAQSHCWRLAFEWRLPLNGGTAQPRPGDVTISHPTPEASFVALPIQTFHISSDAETCEPLTPATIRNLQPGETVVFGLYGVLANGLVEHIADRESWEEAVGLVLRLRKTG